MIKIEDLSFSYPKASRKNLDHLHAEFPEQTVNMIIGKNGSGKTTLFDLIANVVKRPSEIQGIPDEKEIIYQLCHLPFTQNCTTIITSKELNCATNCAKLKIIKKSKDALTSLLFTTAASKGGGCA